MKPYQKLFRCAPVHLLIQQPGFRPKQIILVTTLLDPKRYPKAKLAQLYQWRWMATARQFQAPQNHALRWR